MSSNVIEVSERNFKAVMDARNAMSAALQRLADVSEALARKGDDSVPERLRDVSEADLAEAVSVARCLIDKYGEHSAFAFV